MKRTAVILGAGASCDVHNESVPIANADLRPPLARELFDARFWTYRPRYRGAEVLGAELGHLAHTKGPFDLEERLTEYANSTNAGIRRHFKDIPPYLRDVLVRVSANYVESPANYLRLVTRLLQDQSHEVAFIILNYDTLLERALELYDASLSISGFDDYVASGRQAIVIKIHGSTDWGLNMPESKRLGSFSRAIDNCDVSALGDSHLILNGSRTETDGWRNPETSDFMYPRMTAPLREKTFVCPANHTEALRAFLSECHKFLIIGCSGLDHDLLDFLSVCCDGVCHAHYVNFGGAATEKSCKRFEQGVMPLMLGSAAMTPRIYAQGFTHFLDASGIEDFLAID